MEMGLYAIMTSPAAMAVVVLRAKRAVKI